MVKLEHESSNITPQLFGTKPHWVCRHDWILVI